MNRIRTYGHRPALQAFGAALLASLIALAGAAGLTLAVPAPQAEVVHLERVVITGQRSAAASEAVEIAQLPRVVIEGRRDPAADGAQVASVCAAPRDC